MTQLATYYQRSMEGTNIAPPDGMVRSINEFLRMGAEAIRNDMQNEGAVSYEDLKSAESFLSFYQKNTQDFQGFGLFIFDHQGFYDKNRRYYDWQTLQPFVDAVFRFGIQMPNKARLLQLSRNIKLAVFALDDSTVVNFILTNFAAYTKLNVSFLDEHGRKQSILEAIFTRLQLMKKGSDFPAGSSLWALELLIKRFVYKL